MNTAAVRRQEAEDRNQATTTEHTEHTDKAVTARHPRWPAKTAARGYALLQRAARGIHLLSGTELKRIAQAIRPGVDGYFLRLVLFEDRIWTDGTPGQLYERASNHLVWLGDMRVLLAFFRAEVGDHPGELSRTDVRLVVAFARSADDRSHVWLDCESGLPWVPQAVLRRRAADTDERRGELERRDHATLATAHRVLMEIAREKRLAEREGQDGRDGQDGQDGLVLHEERRAA